MPRSFPCLLALVTLLGVLPAAGADTRLRGRAPAPVVVEELPPAPVAVAPVAVAPVAVPPGPTGVKGPATGPLMAPPPVRFGCQRVWRCDTTICEWRRGCWGVYGYVEGPYYTPSFARRQAEQHGLLFPGERWLVPAK
jgi:hypothetical protein